MSIAVIELDTPESANAWYASTAAQWQQCQGKTVTQPMSGTTFADIITQITNSDGLLTATLTVSTTDGLMTPMPLQRAITTASHYVVDVDVADNSKDTSYPVHADAATAIAHLTTKKITST